MHVKWKIHVIRREEKASKRLVHWTKKPIAISTLIISHSLHSLQHRHCTEKSLNIYDFFFSLKYCRCNAIRGEWPRAATSNMQESRYNQPFIKWNVILGWGISGISPTIIQSIKAHKESAVQRIRTRSVPCDLKHSLFYSICTCSKSKPLQHLLGDESCSHTQPEAIALNRALTPIAATLLTHIRNSNVCAVRATGRFIKLHTLAIVLFRSVRQRPFSLSLPFYRTRGLPFTLLHSFVYVLFSHDAQYCAWSINFICPIGSMEIGNNMYGNIICGRLRWRTSENYV